MARGQPTAARSNAKKGKNTASNKARASSTAKKTAPRRKGVPRNTAVKGRADNASALVPSEDSHCLVPPSVGEDDATLLMQEKFLSNTRMVYGCWAPPAKLQKKAESFCALGNAKPGEEDGRKFDASLHQMIDCRFLCRALRQLQAGRFAIKLIHFLSLCFSIMSDQSLSKLIFSIAAFTVSLVLSFDCLSLESVAPALSSLVPLLRCCSSKAAIFSARLLRMAAHSLNYAATHSPTSLPPS